MRFDPSILPHSGTWGAADETVLNIIHKKKKSPLKIFIFSHRKHRRHLQYDADLVRLVLDRCVPKIPTLWHKLPLCWDSLGRTVKASRVDITLIDEYSIVSAHDNYLDEIQGWDTSVRDMSSRGLIFQGTVVKGTHILWDSSSNARIV